MVCKYQVASAPLTPENRLSCRTSWTLPWEVSLLHPSQLLCQPQGRAHRLPGREPRAPAGVPPPCPPPPSRQPSPGWFPTMCLPSCLQKRPRRLPPSHPDAPPALPSPPARLVLQMMQGWPILSCSFPCVDLPPPPRGEQRLLLSPSQK